MKILVLGAAAGGGFPQWNCNCRNCEGVRRGTLKAISRTQSSVAVTTDSRDWALINCSPDILAQIKACPQLQPSRGIRDTGLRGIVLVDSQIDHTIGLAMLREGERLQVYCTASVYEDLTSGNPLLRMLESYCGIDWHEINIGAGNDFTVSGVKDVRFTAIPVRSKAPPYSPHRNAPRDDDNIALLVREQQSGKVLFYAPGLAAIDAELREFMDGADCMLVDGTLWTDDELIRLGAGRKRGMEMGHLALSGEHGMLAELRRWPNARKVLVHINNTNPVVDEDSAQRHEVESAGIEVAYDGMEIVVGS